MNEFTLRPDLNSSPATWPMVVIAHVAAALRILFQVHWFIGITAGIVLAVVGLTGGMLAFEQEILREINSNVMSIAPGAGSPLSPADLIERIQAQSPGKRIASLTLSSSPEETA